MLTTVKNVRERSEVESQAFADAEIRLGVPGYGSAPMSAKIPAGDLTTILEGERAVETTLKIRVSGFGSRTVDVRVLPVEEGKTADAARTVKLKVPGYGSAPQSMRFARA